MLMPARLHHEQLEVYQKAIAFVAQSGEWTDGIEGNPAVRDQLLRAAESIPLNIAASNTHQSHSVQTHALDIATGSIAECAAALDVMRPWGHLNEQDHEQGRHTLLSMYRMTIALARSKASHLKEDPVEYGEARFPHERLECYQTALSLVRWVAQIKSFFRLPRRCRDTLDRASTALVLNLAEGNARRQPRDKAKFLDISLTSALRLSANLDIALAREWLTEREIEAGKDLLSAAVPQIAGLKRYWLEQAPSGNED